MLLNRKCLFYCLFFLLCKVLCCEHKQPVSNNEINDKKKKVNISFELGKGSYATIIVKHLFSNAF